MFKCNVNKQGPFCFCFQSDINRIDKASEMKFFTIYEPLVLLYNVCNHDTEMISIYIMISTICNKMITIYNGCHCTGMISTMH